MFSTWRLPNGLELLLAPDGDGGAGGKADDTTPPADGADDKVDDGGKTAEEIAAAAAAADDAGKAGENTEGDTSADGDKGKDGEPPAVPDRYELKAPEGSALTAEDLTAIADEAKSLKLTQPEADLLVRIRASDAAVDATRHATYLRELQEDPKLGGAQFDETKRLALKGLERIAAVSRLSDDEVQHVRTFFSGPDGVHKGFVRLFAWLGKAISEDRPPRGGGGGVPERRDTKDVLFSSIAQKG